jgi:hypothetical protein
MRSEMKIIHHAMILSPLLFAGCAVTRDDAQGSTSQAEDLSAFAVSGSSCTGKLCSSYNAGGGLVAITVEDLSRREYTDVTIDFTCTHVSGKNCPPDQIGSAFNLGGGQKITFPYSAPPTNVYQIHINAISPDDTLVSMEYPPFAVLP